MSKVEFVNLIDLLRCYPERIETIKEQYLLLLSELTYTSYIETDLFLRNVNKVNSMGRIVVAVIDVSNNAFDIVGSGTIIIEPKIIRGGKNVGHIEDIVVAKDMRGKDVGQKLLKVLKLIAKAENCYKVILDCEEDVKKVYTKNGFHVKGIQMAEYF